MNPIGHVLIGLVMAIGLVGTLIPVLPGLVLIWFAGLAWVILDGPDTEHWLLFALMSLFFIIGLILSIYLPAKSATGETPKWTLTAGAIFAICGFFLIPIVGAPLGFIFGIFLRILINTREFHRAIRMTAKSLRALGISAVLQCVCGVAICTTWAVGLLVVN